jgi:hypothetical protein
MVSPREASEPKNLVYTCLSNFHVLRVAEYKGIFASDLCGVCNQNILAHQNRHFAHLEIQLSTFYFEPVIVTEKSSFKRSSLFILNEH